MSRIYACAYLSIIVLMLPAPSKAQILRCPAAPAAPAAPASQLLFAILGVQLKADAAAAARIWTRVVLKGQLGVKRGLTPLTSGALLSRAGLFFRLPIRKALNNLNLRKFQIFECLFK